MNGHDWRPIFAIGGALFLGAAIWLATKGEFRNKPWEVLKGLVWVAVICLFGGLVAWGTIDAWFLGGGIPFEEHYRR